MKAKTQKYKDGETIRESLKNGGFIEYEYHTPADIPVSHPIAKIITKIAFMNLFTDAELIAIYDAAKLSTAVHVWIKKLEASTDVKLSSPTTVAGVKSLEAAGLIAKGRAAVILK